MRRVFPLLLIGALGAATVSGCADANQAGGTGTGTDNVLTAIVRIDSAMDTSQAERAGPTPLLLRLDAGNFDFSRARADGADLRVSRMDGSPLPFALRDWSPAIRRASLWVRLDSFRRGAGDRIALTWGTRDAASASDPILTWAGIPDSLRLERGTVLVSDFESGTGALALDCRCGGFYAGGKETTLALPRLGGPFDSAIGSAGAGRTGKALHVLFTATGTEYALVGTRLGHGPNRFGGLDSITLWARGTGAIRVALENGEDTAADAKAWAFIHPDSTWRRFAVRPSDFGPPAPAARGWDAIRDSVTTLTLFLNEGGELWIDDIRLHGLTQSDIP